MITRMLNEANIAEIRLKTGDLMVANFNRLNCKHASFFMVLLFFEWVMAVMFALVVSPQTWIGTQSMIHIHVWAAMILGAMIISMPIFLLKTAPEKTLTRHVVAVAQMLMSVLLIHLSGGRIETHFHVFVSLALLSYYRDWRVLVTASVVIAVDHYIRGIFWPESVFGVLIAGQWRWLEHTAWVVFEDIGLFYAIKQSVFEMRIMAERQATLSVINFNFEQLVAEKTSALKEANAQLRIESENREKLQRQLMQGQKMESLGHMAAGVAHEINNPMAYVISNIQSLIRLGKPLEAINAEINQLKAHREANNDDAVLEGAGSLIACHDENRLGRKLSRYSETLDETMEGAIRIKEIVENMKRFSREGEKAFKPASIEEILDATLRILDHQLKYTIQVKKHYGQLPEVACRSNELGQVFLNIIQNAAQSIKGVGIIRLTTWFDDDFIYVSIKDNGAGIPKDKLSHIFDPFFTTKSVGEGTGLGLSLSYGIVQSHQGDIRVTSQVGKGTEFVVSVSRHLVADDQTADKEVSV